MSADDNEKAGIQVHDIKKENEEMESSEQQCNDNFSSPPSIAYSGDNDEEYLRAIFARLGVGHDGFLSLQELVKVCEAIGMDSLAEEVTSQLFSRLDVERDGRISFKEFLKLFRTGGPDTSSTSLTMDDSMSQDSVLTDSSCLPSVDNAGVYVAEHSLFSTLDPEGAGPSMAASSFQSSVLQLLFGDTVSAVNWCKEVKLIKNKMRCDRCQTLMSWIRFSRSNDGFTWKCGNKHCSKYKAKTSVRKNSFFFNSRLTLKSWIHIIYLWSENVGEKSASRQVGLSSATMIVCYSSLREICANYFKLHPVTLGGPGSIVQIDELNFPHKSKHQQERTPPKHTLVLGVYDIQLKLGYLELVDNGDAVILLPIIEKIVLPGTIIHTDDWKAYRDLVHMGYTDKIVDHSLNFVEKEIGEHTEDVESYWNTHKQKIKTMRGCRREHLPNYLQQFMWRDRFSSFAFNSICEHISEQYK